MDPVSKSRKLVVDQPTKGLPLRDVWQISVIAGSAKERTGYPTQKPLKLLERIIKGSSNPGDVALDPFCGCATTMVAAEALGREWAGIDIAEQPSTWSCQGTPTGPRTKMRRSRVGGFRRIIARTDLPRRTDVRDLPNYRTHRHTLYGWQEGVCGGCRVHFPFRNLTVDHVVAHSKGGMDHLDNLQFLCGACNSKKGPRTQAELVGRAQAGGIEVTGSKKSPAPRCEHCDRNIARERTVTGSQLCEGCYYAWRRDINAATPPKSGSWIGKLTEPPPKEE